MGFKLEIMEGNQKKSNKNALNGIWRELKEKWTEYRIYKKWTTI